MFYGHVYMGARGFQPVGRDPFETRISDTYITIHNSSDFTDTK